MLLKTLNEFRLEEEYQQNQVWYIGRLTGVITIPALRPNGKGLSGWTLFGPTSVPDGGATVMLLAAALGGLGLARRYLIIN